MSTKVIKSELVQSGKEICDALSLLYHNSVNMIFDSADLAPSEVSEETIHETITEHGFNRVNYGSGRTVYTIPDVYVKASQKLIVKFARPPMEAEVNNLQGIQQNEKEANIWNRVKENPTLRREFAPVIYTAPHNRYLVMPKANTENITGNEIEERENELRNKLSNTDISPEYGLDCFGYIDDTLVLLDYGLS